MLIVLKGNVWLLLLILQCPIRRGFGVASISLQSFSTYQTEEAIHLISNTFFINNITTRIFNWADTRVSAVNAEGE